MKQKKKKFFSLLLAMAMLVTAIPLQAADGGMMPWPTEAEEQETEILSEEQSLSETEIFEETQMSESEVLPMDEASEFGSGSEFTSGEEDSPLNQETNVVPEEEPWPAVPGWVEQPPEQWMAPELEEGQILEEIYGQPTEVVTIQDLAELRQMSNGEAELFADGTEEQTSKKLQEITDKIHLETVIYINGKPYQGGNIQVKEGDEFAYQCNWNPTFSEGEQLQEGDWFQYILFTVPHLTLVDHVNSPLLINGIHIGDRELKYDKNTGAMSYQVVFNKYIQLFDPDTIYAMAKGSGKFSGVLEENGSIEVGDITGELEILPRPTDPPKPPEGQGWKPSTPPNVKDEIRVFGKGVKWNSPPNDTNEVPRMEWRVVFLNELQEKQKEFQKTGTVSSQGNYIIEDTLDENQVFFCPENYASDKEYYSNGAPFFLELPVMAVGSNEVLNGGIGGPEYGGSGKLSPYIVGGDHFKKVTAETVGITEPSDTKKMNTAITEYVKKTPLTWSVTKDPDTRQETLTINVGKLDGKRDTDGTPLGITWDMAKGDHGHWPINGVNDRITEALNKAAALESGTDSPLMLLDTRHQSVVNLLLNVVPEGDSRRADLEKWRKSYRTWRSDPQVDVLKSLVDADGNLKVPLPEISLLEKFADTPVNRNQEPLKNTKQYKDFRKSFDNLKQDQETYLKNRTEYAEKWRQAAERYKTTKAFYEVYGTESKGAKPIYGFVLKYYSRSVNTTASRYYNSAKVSMNDSQWNKDKEVEIKFASEITGKYSLGSVVLQKADAMYNAVPKKKEKKLSEEEEKAQKEEKDKIQKVEEEKAGLQGAKFEVYCGELGSDEFKKDEAHKAHFSIKEASAGKDAYRFLHAGEGHTGGASGLETEEVVVNDDGKLILEALRPAHKHYLVETEAPEGYYLDETPIELKSDADSVIYQLLPNVSRSVLLYKADAYSKKPIEGATFVLYQIEADGSETERNEFTSKNINGHQAYVFTKKTEQPTPLKTNAAGELCIHGLPAGTYVLKETVPAPGYENPEPQLSYPFTLSETLPQKDASVGNAAYDESYHFVLTSKENPAENTPGTASLSVLKRDGRTFTPLENAAFTLFRFQGTEEEWKANPEDPYQWRAVSLNAENGEDAGYFRTTNHVAKVELNLKPAKVQKLFSETEVLGEIPSVVSLPAAFSGADGRIVIGDIPLGHYSIAEVQAPDSYQRDFHSSYFDVTEENVKPDGQPLQMYDRPDENRKPVKENILNNYQRKAKLKLVKYDAEKEPPKMDMDQAVGDGWQYESSIDFGTEGKGLSGAVYKLFMRIGASTGSTNPNPAELETTELLQRGEEQYDKCLAVGFTDENGILDLSAMVGKDQQPAFPDGLNLEQYYLIEVQAPEGYRLDQTPIMFPLTEDTFPKEENGDISETGTPGLIKLASNQKYRYGIHLTKRDALDPDILLPGVGFTITDENKNPIPVKQKVPGHYKVTDQETDQKTVMETDQKGELYIDGLKCDTNYLLTEEKTPQGYEPLSAPIAIKTPKSSEDGKSDGAYLYTETTVTNQRLKGKVFLRKQDEETKQTLAGAKFQLYRMVEEKILPEDPDYDPDYPDATRVREEKVEDPAIENPKTTGADGTITWDNLDWYPHYFIREIEAPPGYVLNEARLEFAIDENSFDVNGNPIPVTFPYLNNIKGIAGTVVVQKVDAQDNTKPLEGAEFALYKYVKEVNGNEAWVSYGQPRYVTNEKGEIQILLPPGEYYLEEKKAPDGYLLPVGGGKYFFEVKKIEGGTASLIRIPMENEKGETGLTLTKTLAGTNKPIPKVKFSFYQGSAPETLLFFTEERDGIYVYAEKNAEGVISEIETDEKGQIKLRFPSSFADKKLYYQEIFAPGNIQMKEGIHEFEESLKDGEEISVLLDNELKEEVMKKCYIRLHKQDGITKTPLQGAQFQLYKETEPVGTPKTTDEKGNIIFSDLELGNLYFIKEVKAPEGYVQNETVYRIHPEDFLKDDYTFQEIVLTADNYKIEGTVVLKKTDDSQPANLLKGAEFELFAQKTGTNGSSEEHWEHYGEERYVTDEKGEIRLTLPYGTYYWIERSAPLGYELGTPEKIKFTIDEKNYEKIIELNPVRNQKNPSPAQKVTVVKRDKYNQEFLLKGALFQLYYLSADGYVLYHTHVYETDEKGSFTIENVPAGTYALKEVKAPDGYLLSPEYHVFSVTGEPGEDGSPGTEISVTIENEKAAGDLSVTKTVSSGDQNRDFVFTVTLDRKDISGTYGEMEFKDGVSSFALKHGEKKTALGLPTGAGYRVEETGADGYHVSYTNQKGVIRGGETMIVEVVNTRKAVDPPVDPDPTVSPSITPTPSVAPSPSGIPTPSGTPTPSVAPSPSGIPTPSGTPTPSVTPSPSGTPTPSGTPGVSGTPTPDVSVTPTEKPNVPGSGNDYGGGGSYGGGTDTYQEPVKTGDAATPGLYLGLLLLSSAMIGLLRKYRKTEK